MRQVWLVAVGIVVLSSACGGPRSSPAPENGEVVMERMRLAAAEEARTHFLYFVERQAAGAPNETDFEVVIRMPPESGRQSAIVTLRDVSKQEGQQFTGVIAGPVPGYPEFADGARVTFPEAIVADWSFRRDTGTIGNFSLRQLGCLMANAREGAQKAAALGGRGADSTQRAVIEAFADLDQDTAETLKSLCEPFEPSLNAH